MNSIRSKLVLALTAAMTVVMLLGAWATFSAAKEEANTIFDYHLQQIALALRNQTFQGSTEALAGETSFDFVIRVWDRNGLTIYSSRPHRPLPEIARLGFATERTSEEAWRVYALQYRGETIAVAQPTSVRARLAAKAALRTLTPFMVLLPLIALLIWLIVSRELRPLTDLARSVRTRTPEALDPFTESGVPDEARPLVVSLNELLGRLRAALQVQRDFIADAAHELRTPLAALQLQVGLLERATIEVERSEALGDLKAGLERAIHTVQQLLALARNEAGARASAFAEFSLAEVLREVVADHTALADAKAIDLGVSAFDPEATITGDGNAMRTLLANLVANAVCHTPATGKVDVSCGSDAGRVWLEVVDNGPGIPAEERERVFDRFYRRSGQTTSGSGLGLAIVHSIAQRHKAEIRLNDSAGGGLTVRIEFPGAHPAP
ncbi:MAG: ATP-binding protein [Candidatus Dechloromonas phosphoritropha]|jgi:two-component system OmpR family sensor kinase|nr:sensor histidine kinase N-terminal domain-containing protein [Candidatus Dechloromonas phosphoritropha]MBP8788225.1 sensor histidine kinase N-terminal domain-containing protein [Azonexus sp.]MBP9228696.1 sensor histidine kinase N-terminal domain-containing protein [Azonexus sp.]